MLKLRRRVEALEARLRDRSNREPEIMNRALRRLSNEDLACLERIATT